MTALHDVSVAIEDHQFIGILGPSGSGKSTLLHLALLGKALLADLGMADRLHCFPYEPSDGERQRVAAVRAMVHRPCIMFSDEPTGLLDRHTDLQAMALLRGYLGQGSLTGVLHIPGLLSEADFVITLRSGHISKTVRTGWCAPYETALHNIGKPMCLLGDIAY